MTSDKEKYDAVFELLAAAEMQLRNANYWQVAHKLETAAALAKKYAQDETPNVEVTGSPALSASPRGLPGSAARDSEKG